MYKYIFLNGAVIASISVFAALPAMAQDPLPAYEDGSWVTATGIIAEVSGEEMTLDTGQGNIVVDTKKMDISPLDEEGPRRLEKGDRVYVTGIIDEDVFEDREIQADSIIKLSRTYRMDQ